MTSEAERFHQAADSIEKTNRFLKRASVVAVSLLLAVASLVIVWGALSFQAEVSRVEDRQVQFHRDSTCQTSALDQILIELDNAQQAEQAGRPIPRFVYPGPC